MLGARGTLTAHLGDATANCEALVAQQDGGGPRLEIKIVDEAQGRYRAHVDRAGELTTIKILGGHSAIKRYLGPGPEIPNQDAPTVRRIIAEVAGEASSMVMERKYRTMGDLDGNASSVSGEVLPRRHKMMLDDAEVRSLIS